MFDDAPRRRKRLIDFRSLKVLHLSYLPARDRANFMFLYEAPASRACPGPHGDAVAQKFQNEHRMKTPPTHSPTHGYTHPPTGHTERHEATWLHTSITATTTPTTYIRIRAVVDQWPAPSAFPPLSGRADRCRVRSARLGSYKSKSVSGLTGAQYGVQ